MRTATLGALGDVSRLTLGGGIGQIWGPTIGEAFDGRLPAGVKVTTKHGLGTPAPSEVAGRLTASLDASLAAMRLERVDLFFLHSNIHADGFDYAHGNANRDAFSTSWSVYVGEVVPAMERLKAQGRIGAWGITGIGVPTAVISAIDHTPGPDAVQAIANLMDSPGALKRYAEPARPRGVAAAAKAKGIGVMGIRAVQAGALTQEIDRDLSPNSPDRADYDRAEPFRALCIRWREDPAYVAHRYALSLPNYDTIVLGVKNREELAMCVRAEADGPYSTAEIAEIDGLELV